jgi:hypothetical protein
MNPVHGKMKSFRTGRGIASLYKPLNIRVARTVLRIIIAAMTTMISNADARRIFLAKQGLSAPPNRVLTKDGLLQLIHEIGFVQVDSIQWVERAHHQILFARNQTYKREHLTALLEKDGALFEHWTHDASILPSAFFRYWKHKFRHEEEVLVDRWRKWRGEGFEDAFDETYERVSRDGAIMAREIKADGHVSGGWWNWPGRVSRTGGQPRGVRRLGLPQRADAAGLRHPRRDCGLLGAAVAGGSKGLDRCPSRRADRDPDRTFARRQAAPVLGLHGFPRDDG